jgi:uncharacterized protein (DUF111 family)
VVIGPEEPSQARGTEPGEDLLLQSIVEESDVREVLDALLDAGARAAWAQPVVRPGGVPGMLVQAVAAASASPAVAQTLLAASGQNVWMGRVSAPPGT